MAHDATPYGDVLEAIAARDLVITRARARAAGVPDTTISRLVERRILERVGRGQFVLADRPRTRREVLAGALLVVGGEAALCRRSAAEVHGLRVAADPRPHVLLRDRSWHGTGPVAIHRTRWWFDEHVLRVDGLRVTTVTRTLVDLAGELSEFQLRSAVTAAMREKQTTAACLVSCLDVVGRVRGAATMRAIVADLSPLESQAASALESMFLDLVRRHDLEPTALNYPVIDADGRRRAIDAVYLPEGVPVEVDGHWWHTSEEDRERDRQRERAILATGAWRPFERFTFEDLRDRPYWVVERVRAALAAAREDR